MKEFGVEESWTQFLKISYHDLQLNHDFSVVTLKYHLRFLPLFLSKDGDTLVLSSSQEREAILYNWRDHKVERTGVTVHKTSFLYWDFAKGFVEIPLPSFTCLNLCKFVYVIFILIDCVNILFYDCVLVYCVFK